MNEWFQHWVHRQNFINFIIHHEKKFIISRTNIRFFDNIFQRFYSVDCLCMYCEARSIYPFCSLIPNYTSNAKARATNSHRKTIQVSIWEIKKRKLISSRENQSSRETNQKLEEKTQEKSFNSRSIHESVLNQNN